MRSTSSVRPWELGICGGLTIISHIAPNNLKFLISTLNKENDTFDNSKEMCPHALMPFAFLCWRWINHDDLKEMIRGTLAKFNKKTDWKRWCFTGKSNGTFDFQELVSSLSRSCCMHAKLFESLVYLRKSLNIWLVYTTNHCSGSFWISARRMDGLMNMAVISYKMLLQWFVLCFKGWPINTWEWNARHLELQRTTVWDYLRRELFENLWKFSNSNLPSSRRWWISKIFSRSIEVCSLLWAESF